MLKVLSLLPLAQVFLPSYATTPPTSIAADLSPVAVEHRSQVAEPTPQPSSEQQPAAKLTQLAQVLALPDSDSLIQTLPQRSDVVPQQVRPLPGHLDDVPVFNSNSPELIQKEGILLSTFPGEGMQVRSAHLNYSFQGRFDLFAHHVAKGLTSNDLRTLYVGVVMYNPADRPVNVDILQGVSYLSQEAPFNDLPAYVANPMGTVYAGPGSRVTSQVLRGDRQPQWPNQITIPPKSAQLLMNLPIPLRRLTVATDGTLPAGSIIPGLPPETARLFPPTNSAMLELASAQNPPLPLFSPPPPPPPLVNDGRPLPVNGRTIMMRIASNGPVYLASLAMYAPRAASGDERVPSLAEWIQLLRTGDVAGPRDRPPTPLDAKFVPRFYYGRVAGVAKGSQWSAQLTDKPNVDYLSIPQPGSAFSYVISSVDRNTLGTGQIQSAPMLARYPDTAYRSQGNYGVLYNLNLPLYNNTSSAQRVALLLQTPLQDEGLKAEALRFRNPPYEQVFFRGTVRLRYTDDLGIRQVRYMHLVQRRGQAGEPLIRLMLPQGARRQVEVQLIYPPDSTPPQVLTVQTQPYNGVAEVPSQPQPNS